MTETSTITKATIASADGSVIAYDLSGHGPVVVLVAQALSDRGDHRRLARLLSENDFTVINYDRRGRGESTEATPWSRDREIEDIRSLIRAHGGEASVFGASSGAVLALDAADSLPGEVSRVVSYEAPVIVDDTRPPVPRALAGELGDMVRDGKRSEAVSTFMKRALGAPTAMVWAMRLMVPMWRQMTAMAQTTEYELRLCAGLQDGTRIPDDRWAHIAAPALVMVGERSEAWAHTSADAVAQKAGGEVMTIPRAHHATPTMKPQAIIDPLCVFLRAPV